MCSSAHLATGKKPKASAVGDFSCEDAFLRPVGFSFESAFLF